MATEGLFITFEGIDGAGKSTHIYALAQAFTAQGRAVTRTHEPGGTVLAEKLRSIVLNDSMDAMTETLLVFAARRDHLQQIIEPALARGAVVLCDRFTDASFAYQGGGRRFDQQMLLFLERAVQSVKEQKPGFIRQPDLTLWFDLPVEIAAQRLAGARLPDKFEAQPLAFFQRVAQAYRQRMAAGPARFTRIEADNTRAAVWQEVLQAVRDRGWLP